MMVNYKSDLKQTPSFIAGKAEQIFFEAPARIFFFFCRKNNFRCSKVGKKNKTTFAFHILTQFWLRISLSKAAKITALIGFNAADQCGQISDLGSAVKLLHDCLFMLVSVFCSLNDDWIPDSLFSSEEPCTCRLYIHLPRDFGIRDKVSLRMKDEGNGPAALIWKYLHLQKKKDF